VLGGSFDPPHAGHVHITREALKRFRLDRVWWLVSPGNPLKPRGPAALSASPPPCSAGSWAHRPARVGGCSTNSKASGFT
jgi:nicotinate-nucleotide adenylyltransferase